MKFNIDQAQYDELAKIASSAKANEQVFMQVLANYEACVEQANVDTDEVWKGIVEEHELDMVSHNWAVKLEDSKPVVYNVVQEESSHA